ncbi:MAG: hypothetical protein AUK47_26305 [Deltaproteobacteria bacterium CG2_30_63_29]|nr:MAG: hypothetical protein AUK47_26305 [Deltaproteobacteria bacterium CG2_30_63_29]
MGKSDGRGAPSRQAAHDLMRLPRLLRRELEKSTTTRPALEFFDLLADQLRDTDHLEGYVVRDFLPAVETERSARTALTGSYTFHDMLQQVEAALDDPQHGPALIARLRQRYEVALVDEFQDTDELQWGILQRVFAGDGEGERLVVVGDPKQAIYTFRGGDVFTYQKAQAELAQAAAVPIQLAQNFRSTPRLLEVFDAIFDDETENRLLTGDIRTSKVTPGRQNLRFVDKDGKDLPAMRVLQLNSSTGAAPTKPQLRAALGRTLGQLIHELLQPETGAYLVDNGAAPSDENRVRAKDIYVLTATNHEARLAGRYLREARVPYAFYKQDGLMQTDEAADVRDVLAAILDPNDRAARAKAWMTPFFGLTLGELYRLDDVPEEHSLMRRLRSWSTLAEKRLYEQLFKSMMERSGMLRREVFFGPSERALTNYLHLFELLLDELSVARHALPELLRCLNALITGQQSPVGVDGNVQRLETEVASVQIMTIHKSKGLEAAIVFLYGGLSDPKNKPPCVYHDARGRRLVSSVSPEELGDGGLFAAETAEEQQRLTYVALTRAAGQLVVPKGGRSVALDGLLGALDTRLEVILKAGTLVGSGHVERADVDVFANAAITLAPPPNLAISWHPSEPAEAVLPDYAELKSSKRHVDSYSSFGRRRPPLSILDDPQSDAEVIDGLPAEVPVESLLPRGAHMGLALHELLEKAELERVAEAADGSAWLAQEGARDFVERVLRRHHVRATDPLVQETARVVHATLTTPLPGRDGPVAPIVSCDHVVPEVPFVFPTPLEGHPFLLPNLDGDGNPVPLEIGRGYVKGTIDLLFADQGLVYFADWKSDLLADYGAATMRAHVREHYGWQELFYTLAVVKMLGIREPATYESRFGGRLYVFLRGVRAGTSVTPGVDFFRPSWQRLAKYEERIRTTASASADESDDDTLAGDA